MRYPPESNGYSSKKGIGVKSLKVDIIKRFLIRLTIFNFNGN